MKDNKLIIFSIIFLSLVLILTACSIGGEGNTAPKADAGPNMQITTGSIVTLDGNYSHDADGDSLSYAWSFTSRPTGSAAFLSDSTAVNPTFLADIDGSYVISLVVNDGTVNSSADTVAVTATSLAAIPNAPMGLTATAVTYTSVNLTWTDNSDNENGFMIERKIGSSSFTELATTLVNDSDYIDNSVSASTTYTYRVKAFNNDGESGYSNTATVMTTALPVTEPTAPSNLQAINVTTTTSTLTWQDNSDNEDGFEIGTLTPLYPQGNLWNKWADVSPNTTSYTLTGLSNSTTYTFYVRAYNATGYSRSGGITFTTDTPPLHLVIETVFAKYDNSVLFNSLQDQSSTGAASNTVYNDDPNEVGVDWGVGPWICGYLEHRTFIYFDIDSMIGGHSVQKAILRLYVYMLAGDMNTSYIVHALAANWYPSTLTFNTMPDHYWLSPSASAAAPFNSVLPVEWDVTAIVQKWANGERMNYGFIIWEPNPPLNSVCSGYLRTTYFQSIEEWLSYNERPQLYLEYY